MSNTFHDTEPNTVQILLPSLHGKIIPSNLAIVPPF